LWRRTFDAKWLIEKSHLRRLFPGSGSGVVALSEGRVIGFVGLVPSHASLSALLVEEESRRRGVGAALFRAGVEQLRRAGIGTIVAGGLGFLWKGIPIEFEPALAFFRAQGGTFPKRIYDQICELRQFRYPAESQASLRGLGLRLRLAQESDAERIVAFEDRYFPRWAPHFHDFVAWRRFDSIAYVESDEGVVGTMLVDRLGEEFPGIQWRSIAQRPIGSCATLGVDPAWRGKGVAFALVSYGVECVRESGAELCFFNYSEAVPLYRKIGFVQWAEYQACELEP
jgi:GNAT superfamily N-acetyltransferase